MNGSRLGMNRGTALLLAMAAFLAHALALHQDGLGEFAPAHESAHIAYRLARNLVHHGVLAWSQMTAPDGSTVWVGGLESCASPLLVGLAWVAERIYLPVTSFTQFAGIVASLLTVALAASFAIDRIAGIIPALLLVASGGLAAAAASGTEIPFLALGMGATLVAYEHRWPKRLAGALPILILARLDGAVVAGFYFLLAVLERWIPRKDGARPMPFWTYLPACAVMGVLLVLRGRNGDSILGAALLDLLHCDRARAAQGLATLSDYVLGTGIPLLTFFPIVATLLRKISGAGARSLAVSLVWMGIVVLEGGGSPAFSLAYVPAMPVLYVAIQQGVIAALDTYWKRMEALSWVTLIAAVCVSALASKFPGNLGPFQVEGLHRAWMRSQARAPYGRSGVLGRLALREEIALVGQLRELGASLQANVQPERTILTPWPGVIGYLSRARVIDLFDRTGAAQDGRTPLTSWWERPVDVVQALEQRPDYIVPGLPSVDRIASRTLPETLAREMMRADIAPDDPERLRAVRRQLEAYALISIPHRRDDVSRRIHRSQPFYLLQSKSLRPRRNLAAHVEEGRLIVDLQEEVSLTPHEREPFPQLARLRIHATDSTGQVWYIDPTGHPTSDPNVSARVSLTLETPHLRPTRLFEADLPTEVKGRTLQRFTISLVNPTTRGSHFLTPVCEEIRFP